MKSQFKISIYILLFFVLGFTIKSRIVSRENFDLMVLMTTNEILESCNNKTKAKANGEQFEIPESVQYYFTKYGDDLCNDSENLRKKIEESTLSSLKSNWLFVL